MDKVFVITGANRGIGYGIAKSFSKNGYIVVALNRTLCNETWMTEIKCDLTNQFEVHKSLDYIITKFGRIDVLVNNAGIRRFAQIDEISDKDWNESLATNVTTPLWIIRKCTSILSENNGLLVFVGSQSAEYPFEEGIAYSTTKAAFHAMSKIALEDLRYRGIRVCLISLGAVANRPKENDEWKIQPADVGQLVVSLSELPTRVMPSFVELRPSAPLKSPISKLEALQYI